MFHVGINHWTNKDISSVTLVGEVEALSFLSTAETDDADAVMEITAISASSSAATAVTAWFAATAFGEVSARTVAQTVAAQEADAAAVTAETEAVTSSTAAITVSCNINFLWGSDWY